MLIHDREWGFIGEFYSMMDIKCDLVNTKCSVKKTAREKQHHKDHRLQ